MGYLFGLKVISDPDCCFDSDCPFERNVSNRIHSRCPQDSLLMSTATNAGLVQAGQVDAVLENRWNTVMDPLQWEIQVEQSDGMWWTIPYWLSNPILQELQMATPRISYIWDWKWSNWNNPRKGSYKPDGQTTTINRYIINFDTMYQKNIDKPDKGDRKVKIVSVIR